MTAITATLALVLLCVLWIRMLDAACFGEWRRAGRLALAATLLVVLHLVFFP